MNIYEQAKNGSISNEEKFIAEKENLSIEETHQKFKNGEIAIIKNSTRDIAPMAIGSGTTTKVNANIGSSPDLFDIDIELKKLHIAIEAGADAVMDLSTGGNLVEFRQTILKECSVPLGTVPLYEMAVNLSMEKKSVMDMTIEDYLAVVQKQAEEGVDFMTIHSGITLESIKSLKSQERIIGITSRGGSI